MQGLEWNVTKIAQKHGHSYAKTETQCMVLACGMTTEIQFTLHVMAQHNMLYKHTCKINLEIKETVT